LSRGKDYKLARGGTVTLNMQQAYRATVSLNILIFSSKIRPMLRQALRLCIFVFLMHLFTRGANAQSVRYIDEIFTTVTVSTNIVYAQNYEYFTNFASLQPISMDVYRPAGDTATNRPLILIAHNGDFLPVQYTSALLGRCYNDRKDSAVVELCKRFAKRGYVAVAFDYRLGWLPTALGQENKVRSYVKAVYRGMQDAKSLIRYFKNDFAINANSYGIDTSKIVLAGSSSGAHIVVTATSLNKVSEINAATMVGAGQGAYIRQDTIGDFDGFGGIQNYDNYPGISSGFQCALVLGGDMVDTNWIEAGEVPIIAFHGLNGTNDPYNSAITTVPNTSQQIVRVYGSGNFMGRVEAFGNNNGFKPNFYLQGPPNYTGTAYTSPVEGLYPFYGIGFEPWNWYESVCYNSSSNMQALNPGTTALRAKKYIDTIMMYAAPRLYKLFFNPTFNLPATVLLPANKSVCNGTVITQAPIVSGTPPLTYAWATTGSALSCNSCANPTVTVTQSTTIKVTVTDANNSTAIDSITYTPNTCSVSLGTNKIVCPGTAITLNTNTAGGQGPYTYLWSATGNLLSCSTCAAPTATITQNSVYTVTVLDITGVVGIDTIYYTAATNPLQITANGPTTLCQGSSVTLSAGLGYSAYYWSTGEQTQTITVSQSGNYIATITTIANCSFKDTITVTFNVPTISNYQIAPNDSTTICGGGSISLDAGNGFVTYLWNTGSSSSAITVSSYGSYSVTVLGTDGCEYTDTVSLATSNYNGQQICLVSVDSATGKNIVVWKKPVAAGVDSFNIYRETTVSGQLQFIHQQSFTDAAMYIDQTSTPQQSDARYVITTVDACGESQRSSPHKTMHLALSIGANDDTNLSWSSYEGVNFITYTIYRGSSLQSMQLLAQVGIDTLNYVDSTPPAPPLFYRVETMSQQSCDSNFTSSFSNVVQIDLSALDNLKNDATLYSYYNAAGNTNMLAWENLTGTPVEVKLYDLTGRVVLNLQNVTANEIVLPSELSKAFYVVELKAQGVSTHRKIHIQ
jgi:hypothetical protein